MIRPKLSLRRPLAVLGAAFLGLTAAVAVAAPASAHHSEVKVAAECDTKTGEWVVDWTVNSYAPVKTYKFIKVDAKSWVGEKASDLSIPGIEVTKGDEYPHSVGTPVKATTRLAGETTKARLAVKAKWDNGHQDDKIRAAAIDLGGKCAPDEQPPPKTAVPSASMVADCDGNVDVKLVNGKEATADAEFEVTAGTGFEPKKVTVKPDADATVKVEAKYATHIKVTAKGEKEPLLDAAPTKPEDCVAPGEPAGSIKMTCDKLIFQIVNPEDGETIEVTLTPNKGEAKQLVVKAGETGTVEFDAFEGLTVTPSAEGMGEGEPIAWIQPENCDEEGGPTLPVTGAQATGIAGGAAVLVAVGAGLFVLNRRRKIRFTA
ncbi:LPXTG cell wall anchor domain-containing protein [Plantactinospora sp. GCM10030261]|uniref:LPXTG cell wall anchor domain-containing protein n=1 Tax=Plantactinospora sp. GCM10030261 TaxID=3273420 RepID=UPI003616C485